MAENTQNLPDLANKNKGFYGQIRTQLFYIEVYLYNGLDGYSEVQIPTFNIDSFSVEETLLDWIVKGYITISNPFEILERGSYSNIDPLKPQNTGKYLFRTDGRNKLSLRFFPLDSDGNPKQPFSNWEMSYDFVIYDYEDIDVGNNQKKLRRFYFWDERYQILCERNIQYSTYYSKLNTIHSAQKTDLKATPNFAIQDILKTTSSNPPVFKGQNPTNVLNVGYTYGGKISNPTLPMVTIDTNNWDFGPNNDPTYGVSYTSPSKSKAIEDLDYVLGFCTSKESGPVFLRFGRSSDDKKFKLVSLASLFQTSTQNQIEHLYIEDGVDLTKPKYDRASPNTDNNSSINFTSPEASRITSYKFAPMAAIDDNRIENLPLYYYDFVSGTFNAIFTNNTPIAAKEKLEQFGKMGLYNFTKGDKSSDAHLLLTINQSKVQGYNTGVAFAAQEFFPKNLPQIKMMQDALFLNQAITFQVKGLSIRTPGKFIYIDRVSANGEINHFDDRFLGQWLIVKVNHFYSQAESQYMNEIVAVKVDSHSKIWNAQEKGY
jgi:hypothetical protein